MTFQCGIWWWPWLMLPLFCSEYFNNALRHTDMFWNQSSHLLVLCETLLCVFLVCLVLHFIFKILHYNLLYQLSGSSPLCSNPVEFLFSECSSIRTHVVYNYVLLWYFKFKAWHYINSKIVRHFLLKWELIVLSSIF